MVHYGKRLLALRYEPWKEHYVDYNQLKRLLEHGHGHGHGHGQPHSEALLPHDTSTVETAAPSHRERIFREKLDSDIEDAVLFCLQRQGKLAERLRELKQRKIQCRNDVRTIVTGDTTTNDIRDTTTDAETATETTTTTTTNTSTISDVYNTVEHLHRAYREEAEVLVKLLRFAEVNLTAVRKILKKHDRIYADKQNRGQQHRHENTDRAKWTLDYFAGTSNSSETQETHLNQWLHDNSISPIVATLRNALAEIQHMERTIQQYQQQQQLSSIKSITTTQRLTQQQQHHQEQQYPNPPRRNHTSPDLFLAATEDLLENHSSSYTKQLGVSHKASRGNTSDSNLVWQYDLQLQQEQQQQNDKEAHWQPRRLLRLEPVLIRIEMARSRLHESNEFIKLLAAPSMFQLDTRGQWDDQRRRRRHRHHQNYGRDDNDDINAPPPHQEEADEVHEIEMLLLSPQSSTPRVRISKILNLMSTFLYMTNYYIAAPTSGAYAAKLHGSPALAGLVIGMTPTAALAGTLLYSYWTNYSYKAALIFAASSAMIGNILYALALPYESLTYVLIGRLLIGFGSCRSINRRYIADSYSREDRTAASAAFVTAGSLGMAVGPAVAAVLDWIIPVPTDYWCVENAPGWVMFVAWVVFIIFLVRYFCDPPTLHQDDPRNQKDMTEGERRPLLPSAKQNTTISDGSISSAEEDDPPLLRNIPVMATLIICFLLKMMLECCLSSTATVTSFFFHWDASQTGIYLALLGLLMFPANLVVAYFSKRYEDRDLILCTLVLMVIGSWGIVSYGGVEKYTTLQYIGFSVVIFVSTNALEGPNMSLLSKTIPHSWSRGFFNMGLLATEAGTFGRTVGDFAITWFGLGSIESMLNHTFVFLGSVVGVTVIVIYHIFPFLEPRDKDD